MLLLLNLIKVTTIRNRAKSIINLLYYSKNMGNFKIEKKAADEPVYCDYIQEKVDIAKQNNAVYELDDEDNRIQALYNQEELTTKDKIKVINRIRSNDDGKEYIVVNKNVDFFTPDGVYKDRYSTREGIVELPIKTTNPETGATETKQNRIVYTIPFNASNVDEYLDKAEDQGGLPTLTFYDGSTTSDRLPSVIPVVGNPEFFKEATWTELLLGREKKIINSLENKISEVRKSGKGSDSKPTEVVQRQEIKPSDINKSPKEEVNKQEAVKENNNIVEKKSSGGDQYKSTGGFSTGGTNKKN